MHALRTLAFRNLYTTALCACFITASPTFASPLGQGFAHCNAKRYAEAVAIFEKNLDDTYGDANAEFYYARSLEGTGSGAKAMEVYQDLIHRHSKSEPAAEARAKLDRWMKDVSKASLNLGITGIEFAIVKERPVITKVFDDTPAANSLKSGDIIVRIDGVDTDKLSEPTVRELLLGRPGTRCTLLVSRLDSKLEVTVERASVREIARKRPDLAAAFAKGAQTDRSPLPVHLEPDDVTNSAKKKSN